MAPLSQESNITGRYEPFTCCLERENIYNTDTNVEVLVGWRCLPNEHAMIAGFRSQALEVTGDNRLERPESRH